MNITHLFSLDDIKYEQVSEETLESLSEYLEELMASDTAPQDCDVLYSVSTEAERVLRMKKYYSFSF